MRVLFDQGTPAPRRLFLTGHEVATAHELGWSHLKNGELLSAAEASFDIFITTDQIYGISRIFQDIISPFLYFQPPAGRSLKT